VKEKRKRERKGEIAKWKLIELFTFSCCCCCNILLYLLTTIHLFTFVCEKTTTYPRRRERVILKTIVTFVCEMKTRNDGYGIKIEAIYTNRWLSHLQWLIR
jgi:hypothetical protein